MNGLKVYYTDMWHGYWQLVIGWWVVKLSKFSFYSQFKNKVAPSGLEERQPMILEYIYILWNKFV